MYAFPSWNSNVIRQLPLTETDHRPFNFPFRERSGGLAFRWNTLLNEAASRQDKSLIYS